MEIEKDNSVESILVASRTAGYHIDPYTSVGDPLPDPEDHSGEYAWIISRSQAPDIDDAYLLVERTDDASEAHVFHSGRFASSQRVITGSQAVEMIEAGEL